MSLYSFGASKKKDKEKEKDPGKLAVELAAGPDTKRSGATIYRPGKAPQWADDQEDGASSV